MSRTRPPLRVGPDLEIPGGEVQMETSRSGGPGGQNVNKVETKVTLRLNLVSCLGPSDDQRRRLLERLESRLTKDGDLLVQASRFRERLRNEEDARERLIEVLRQALMRQPRRKRTRPTRGSKERRLTAKRVRSEVKRQRGRGKGEE